MPDLQPFIDRCKDSGASEKANFPSFIHKLCEELALHRPDPATDQTRPTECSRTRQLLRIRRTSRSRSSVLNIGRLNAKNNALSASSPGRKVAFVRWHFL